MNFSFTTRLCPYHHFLFEAGARAATDGDSIYDLTAMQYGKETSLDRFKDQVTVVLNVASE